MKSRAHRLPRDASTGERSERVPDSDGDALRRLIQQFIRRIGLLSSDQTPCGHPLAVSHAHALMVLLESSRVGRHPTQQELGRVLGIDKSNVARLCRKMEQAGQVKQERCAEDGRSRLLSLTDRGVRLARNVERSSRERFERLMAAVPGNDRKGILSALAILNGALAGAAIPSPSREPGRRSTRASRAGVPSRAREERLASAHRVARASGTANDRVDRPLHPEVPGRAGAMSP